ncbi:MAG: PhoH family protein [Phycisphaerae bacterium]
MSRRLALYGSADRNLRLIRSAFDVRISARDSSLRITGPENSVAQAGHVVEELQRILRSEPDVSLETVEGVIERARGNGKLDGSGALNVFLPSAVIKAKGEGQAKYIQAIQSKDLTFCVGPAGTGKTYLAVAVSVALLRQHKIKRIVLVRPAVEAGEKLGYLPGDLQAKVNPYLRPLFDAMHDMMTFDQLKRFMESDVVEVVPLAFMRGRTLNHAAIILDEAQNTTPGQMLMFLTRLGHGSKMIVTGDDSQSDLGAGAPSGLRDAVNRLSGIDGVALVRLTVVDIVRHPLVQEVVERYGGEERVSDKGFGEPPSSSAGC